MDMENEAHHLFYEFSNNSSIDAVELILNFIIVH